MRLIDADALMDDIQTTVEESGCVNHEGEILDCIEYTPTIDALPVVRCKDCKHNESCFINEMIIAETKQDNPYCSAGAKMEDKP